MDSKLGESMKRIILLIGVFVMGCSHPIPDYAFEKRVALVIGNQNYKHKVLSNPIHDADGVVEVLKRLNFKSENILLAHDVNAEDFFTLLESFKKKIDNETIAFFYFAGHANTITRDSTKSFLMMVDSKEDALVSIYKIYEVLDKAGAKHNIIAIDACRDYREVTKKDKVVYRGGIIDLTTPDERGERRAKIYDNNHSRPPFSTIVSFAADVNEGARDKGLIDTTHSPYSRYLIEYLDDSRIPVGEVFNRVRKSLRKELHGKQRNLETGALEGNPWLNPKRGDIPVAPAF